MTGVTFTLSRPRSIDIDKANPFFGVYDEFIMNFEEDSVVRYFGTGNTVLIAKRFLGIGAGCFHNLHYVSRVHFEAGSRVSWFGRSAFFCCWALSSFSIPSTVETIAEECFSNCYKLKKITFESVSRVCVLGDAAFWSCWSLTSICLPTSVTRIGTECFRSCCKLAIVTVEAGIRISHIGESAFSHCAPSLRLPLRSRNASDVVAMVNRRILLSSLLTRVDTLRITNQENE
jgi:hypothetical protein